MKKFFLFLFALVSADAAFAQFTPDTMMRREAYTNQTAEVFKYRIWSPQFLRKGEKLPVILFLHGSGECGTDNEKQLKHGIPLLLNQLLKQNIKAIVIAPQCQMPLLNSWVHRIAFKETYSADKNPALGLETALEIAQHVIDTQQGDPDRFYITGLSLGGFGTWDAIQREPDRFAAAAPICAGGDTSLAPRLKNLPIWVAHGEEDKNVPVECSIRMVNAIKAAGGRKIVYHQYPKVGHDVWNRVYGDPKFVSWLLEQRRNKPWWKFW